MNGPSFQIVDDSGKKLHKVVQSALDAVAMNLHSLIERPIEFAPKAPLVLPQDEAVQEIEGEFLHLDGQFDNQLAGTVHLFFELREAIALSSFLRMLPDDVVTQNRKAGQWEDDDNEAMKEVGNILFSALDETFRSATTKKTSIRIDGVERISFGGAPPPLELETDTYVLYPFSCKIHKYPDQLAWMLIPLEAAEELNQSPLQFAEGPSPRDTLDDDIEDAPIRGELVAYVADAQIQRTLRRACRRTGLRFDKRPRNEVPNPAAHDGKIVFLEIDVESAKRFDWCRRLKLAHQEIHVVILLVRPNKMMVASAFKAKADAIVGWPIDEELLAAKLGQVFDAARA